MTNKTCKRHTDIVVCKAIGVTILALEDMGYRIDQSSDFAKFRKICEGRKGRLLSAQSDEDFFDFTEANSFSLVAYDANNVMCGTVASRLDMLGKTSLACHFNKQYKRIWGGRVGRNHAPGAFEISGKVDYQGDLWVHQEHRSMGLGYLLAHLSLLISLNKFDPDFSYALIAPQVVSSQLALRAGYSCTESNAIEWKNCPDDFNEDFWLAYSSKDSLYHVAYNQNIQNNKT